MKIEEILEEWDKDCIIDSTNISKESIKIPELHNKYYKIFLREKIILDGLELSFKELELKRWNFYNRSAPKEEYEDYSGNFFDLKLLKTDQNRFMDADEKILEHKKKICVQQAKVEALKEIIKTISNRSFQIKNFIDYEKFKAAEF